MQYYPYRCKQGLLSNSLTSGQSDILVKTTNISGKFKNIYFAKISVFKIIESSIILTWHHPQVILLRLQSLL